MLDDFDKPIRKDRPEDQGGGIIVYTRKGIITHRRYDLELQNLESVWLDITHNRHRITLGTVYRPPKSPVYKWNLFAQMVENALVALFDNLDIVGDLNDDLLPDTPFHLKNIMKSFQLSQLIDEPTRITPTSRTLLDPIVTNNLNLVKTSHHSPVITMAPS